MKSTLLKALSRSQDFNNLELKTLQDKRYIFKLKLRIYIHDMLQEISIVIYHYSSLYLPIQSLSVINKGLSILNSQHNFLQEIMEYQDILEEKDEDYLQVIVVILL